MVVKLYISGISGNKEVKKKQQRVQMILDSKHITYEAIDITEPGKEKDKEFMQQNGKVREALGKHPLPPQIFNDDSFCGDYEDFDLANEIDELEKFLHIEVPTKGLENGSKVNGTREEINDSVKTEAIKESSEEKLNTEVNGVEENNEAPESPSDNVNEVVNTEITVEDAQPSVNEVEDLKPTDENDEMDVVVSENEDEAEEEKTAEEDAIKDSDSGSPQEEKAEDE